MPESGMNGGLMGEVWLLSDRTENQSVVADGSLHGWTISDLMERYAEGLLGANANRFRRFPILLKFLNARTTLSVQVHPSDRQPELLPPGESGKTEAWVVLEAGIHSRIYSGLKPGTTSEDLARDLLTGTVVDHLVAFTPEVGDCFFIPAGTVHSLGGDMKVFEIQQNSDVTYRLYDWNQIDQQTGEPRELQIEQALASIDFSAVPCGALEPVVESTETHLRERLVTSDYFSVWRVSGETPFEVGAADGARVVVPVVGDGAVEYNGVGYPVKNDEALLLPAAVGVCRFYPNGVVSLLEVSIT